MHFRLALFLSSLISAAVAQTTPLLLGDGPAAGGAHGAAVAAVGDVDGDGHRDFAVGAPGLQGSRGAVAVLSGRDGSVLRVLLGPAGRASSFGAALASGGDADGDGAPDLVIGMPNSAVAGSNAGEARVYSLRTGALLHRWQGGGPGDLLGSAVTFVGDVDVDGHDDVLLGAPENGDPVLNYGEGYAQVMSGRNGRVLYRFRGTQRASEFGAECYAVGDVDRDGRGDFTVTSYLERRNGSQGSVRLYSGRTGSTLHEWFAPPRSDHFGTGVASPGDLDGDGVRDVVVGSINMVSGDKGTVSVLSGRSGERLALLRGSASSGILGMRVVAVGDLDADGVGDFAVSDPMDRSSGAPRGSVTTYSGADRSILSVTGGSTPGSMFGMALRTVDLDADGILELLVGAPGQTVRGARVGRYTVFCQAPTCRFGTGCAPLAPPRLSGTRAAAGGSLGLFVDARAAGLPGVLLASSAPSSPSLLAPGCTVHLDPASAVLAATLRTDPAGSWTASYGVPGDPALVGMSFALQVALAPTGGGLGADLSNGLYVTVTQ